LAPSVYDIHNVMMTLLVSQVFIALLGIIFIIILIYLLLHSKSTTRSDICTCVKIRLKVKEHNYK